MPQEESLDVMAYLRRLRKHLLPALGIGLLVMLALAGLSLVKGSSTTYQQKAHVLVFPNQVSTDAQATQQAQLVPMMMRTYVALEDVPTFVDAVSARTGGKFTPEQVRDQLTIYWGGGSNLLAFQATSDSLDSANQLADAGAEVFVQKAEQIAPSPASMWKPTLRVVERDKQLVPPASSGGLDIPTAVAGGLGAFLLSLLVLEALAALRGRGRGNGDASTRTRTSIADTPDDRGATRA